MFYQESALRDELKCSICQEIFSVPRMLPCGHTFCNDCIEALKNKGDENILTCIECNKDHSLLNDFPVNFLVSKMIQMKPNEVIQSKSVFELKKSLSLLTDRIESLQSNLDNGTLAIHEHCNKLRRDVQLNTQLHIEKIKDFNEKLIKQINDYEQECVSKYEVNIVIDSNSIENLLKELRIFTEEKRKYLARFQINDEDIEISQIEAKDNLEKLSEDTFRLEEIKFNGAKKTFRANDQKFDADILGSIADDGEFLKNKMKLESTILTWRQKNELMKLCEFERKSKWTLLYRGSHDGFAANMFHAKCDGKLKTLTIVKSTNGNIFGGYTEIAWDQSLYYKHDPYAFLFSLVNTDNQPIKIKNNGDGYAIYCHTSYSVTFGGGCDLKITSDANANQSSFSNLGDSYPHPKYAKGSVEAQSFLAGSHKFQIAEIEVFQFN